jgi:hypothetical protein
MKFVNFNYYWRDIDWYAAAGDNYYSYLPIGKKLMTLDNIGPDFQT